MNSADALGHKLAAAAADTFAVENAAAHTADAVFGIAVGSSAVAHSTAARDIAGAVVAVEFVGVHLHPCRRGSLLWTGCRSGQLASFQLPEGLPLGFPGAGARHAQQLSHPSFASAGRT